jgi:hypothetical protein
MTPVLVACCIASLYLIDHVGHSFVLLILAGAGMLLPLMVLAAWHAPDAQRALRRKDLRTKARAGGLACVRGHVRSKAQVLEPRGVVMSQCRINASLAKWSLRPHQAASVLESVDFDVVTSEGRTVRLCLDGALLAGPDGTGESGLALDPMFNDLLTTTFAAPIVDMHVRCRTELRDGAPVEVFGVLSTSGDELVAGPGGLVIFPLMEQRA